MWIIQIKEQTGYLPMTQEWESWVSVLNGLDFFGELLEEELRLSILLTELGAE